MVTDRNERHRGEQKQQACNKCSVVPLFVFEITDHKNRHRKKEKTDDLKENEPKRIKHQITVKLRQWQLPPEGDYGNSVGDSHSA